jgi:hypothetical protein
MESVRRILRERQDLLIGLAIGACVGWIVSTAPGWAQASSYKNWWDIATAIGTVGTVVVATALALRDGNRRRREAILKANLVAAGIRSRLLRIRFELDQMSTWMEQNADFLADESARKRTADRLESLVRTIAFSEVEALAVAPDNVALHLMNAYDRLRIVITGLGYPMKEWKPEYNNAYITHMRQAIETLAKASIICERFNEWR